MKQKRRLEDSQIVSKCGWTPYHGKETAGDVVLTMVRGKVVMRDGKVVATCMAGYEGHRGWINYLAVSPHHRRQGIGRRIMEEAEKRL